MPGRRPQGPDPRDDVKRLTLEDIEVGVRKLNRRIGEVRALGPQIRYDDARVESATRNIKADLIDIFGRGSQEYRAHGAHSIGYQGSLYGVSDTEMQHDFLRGLPDTVLILGSLIKRLEENREDLGGDTKAQVRASFAGLDLRPVCEDLYRGVTTGMRCSMPRWPS